MGKDRQWHPPTELRMAQNENERGTFAPLSLSSVARLVDADQRQLDGSHLLCMVALPAAQPQVTDPELGVGVRFTVAPLAT